MSRLVRLRRLSIALVVVLGALAVAYFAWNPGREVTDGRHDLGRNGMWLQHGWLGDDSWFARNKREDRKAFFRSEAAVRALVEKLRGHGITDVFPHLCPAQTIGEIPPVDAAQTERFLDLAKDLRVIPWIGGVFGDSARPREEAWRRNFVRSAAALLRDHPRLAGVQVNVEPCPSGEQSFLRLLEDLRAALPPGKVLSVAAYPPPTAVHPYPEVHWDEAYFREVAARSDHLAVMMYDTALRLSKPYERLMAIWTGEILAWSGQSEVLLGLPAYDDAGVGYHDPAVENLATGLRGIHAGLDALGSLPAGYRGVAVYSDWEMDEAEWGTLRASFLRKP